MMFLCPASEHAALARVSAAMKLDKQPSAFGGFAAERALSRFVSPTAYATCVAQQDKCAAKQFDKEMLQHDFEHNGYRFDDKAINLSSRGQNLIIGKEPVPGVVYVLLCLQQPDWPKLEGPPADLLFEFVGYGVGGVDPFVRCPPEVMARQPFWLPKQYLHGFARFADKYL